MVKLTLGMSPEAAEKLQKLFNEGKCPELVKMGVTEIKIEREEDGKSERN